MDYYLISFVATVALFSLIQIYEYTKQRNEDDEPYSITSTKNFLLFAIIYLLSTIGAYFLYSSNFNLDFLLKSKKQGGGGDATSSTTQPIIKEEINPQVLSKINDNFDIGLDPFNSDASSISSLSSN